MKNHKAEISHNWGRIGGENLQKRTEISTVGIDVSRFDGNIDWTKVTKKLLP